MDKAEVRCPTFLECFDIFSKEEPTSDQYIHGGVFYSNDEKYRKNMAILFKRVMAKKNLEQLFQDFQRFLEDKNFDLEGRATYKADSIIWNKPREVFKESKQVSFDRSKPDLKFKVFSSKVANPSDISHKSGFIILKLIDIEGGPITSQKIWDGRATMLKIWQDETSNNKIKNYIEEVLKLESAIKTYLSPGDIEKPYVQKLLGYVAPFSFVNFEGNFLLSRASLFWKKKKPEEVIQEVQKANTKVWEDINYCFSKENLSIDWLMKLLHKVYDKKFLDELRKDWKNILKKIAKGYRNDALAVYITKDNTKRNNAIEITFGKFNAPSNEIETYIYYEESIKKEDVNKFKDSLLEINKKYGTYTGNISLKIEKVKPLSDLIPKFNELKKVNYSKEILHKNSIDILYSLFYFACRMKSFVHYILQNKKPAAIIILLDTDIREENGSYPFWEYFRMIYDFFSFPVQVINKTTIQDIINKNPSNIKSIYKNTFISLLKDTKSLEFQYESMAINKDIDIYVFFEKPSPSFCYKRKEINNQQILKNFLYEVYKVSIKPDKVIVDLDKKFITLAGGIDVDTEEIRRFIEKKASKENTRFIFITSNIIEKSNIKNIINKSEAESLIAKNSMFMQYKEIPMAYISNSFQGKALKECLVIHTSDFIDIQKALKMENTNRSIIAIKPISLSLDSFKLPNDDETYFHQSLQVFFTNSFGWEEVEVYNFQKNIAMLSLLAVFQYESESYNVPYRKLDLWKKKNDIYLKIRRNNTNYTISLGSILYELLYNVSKIPIDGSHDS